MRRIILAIFWLSLFQSSLANKAISLLTSKGGLCNDYVTTITQDKLNFIWIGTEMGITRYDSKSMNTYLFDPQNQASLSNNFIHDIFTYAEVDSIYIATDDGLNLYRYTSNQFKRYYNTANSKNPSCFIKITTRNSASLWVLEYNTGILAFDKKNGTFTPILSLQEKCPISGFKATDMIITNEGNCWMSTTENGLFYYHTGTEVVRNIRPNRLHDIKIETLFELSDDLLLIGTEKGLFLFNCQTNEIVPTPQFKLFEEITIKKIRKTELGASISFATSKGVYVIPKVDIVDLKMTQLTFRHYPSLPHVPNFVIYANNIMEDKDNNIWVATAGTGVKLALSQPSRFGFLPSPDLPRQVRETITPTISPAGSIWLCYFSDEIYTSDTSQVNFSKITQTFPNKKRIKINSAHFASSSILWLASNEGLLGYNSIHGRSYQYNTQNSNLPGNDVRAVAEDKRGNLWLATAQGCICCFYLKSQSFEIFNLPNKNISDITILEEGIEGVWWIGTRQNGLHRFDWFSGELISFNTRNNDGFVLPDNYITSLHYDSSDRLWIGMRNGGMVCFNDKEKKFIPLSNSVKLPQSVSGILSDKEGNLWIAGIHALYCFNMDKNIFVEYGRNVFDDIYFTGQGVVAKNKKIFFPTTNGFIFFSPETFFSPPESINQAIITQILTSTKSNTDNEPICIDSLQLTKKLELKHFQCSFSIHFISPNYTPSNEIQYAYYLKGIENTWNYVGSNNRASYRNLPPGDYTFKIRTGTGTGEWSDKITEIDIVITPPLWNTTWMKILYIIILTLASWTLLRLFRKRMAMRDKQKEKIIERRKTEEMNQLKLQFVTNISHEIRTPITLIINPLSKLIKDEVDPEKQYSLQLMNKNCRRLLHLINEMIDFRKLSQTGGQLHYTNTHIVQLIRDLTDGFSYYSENRKIKIEFIHPEKEILISIDRNVVEKTVTNLLSNAVKFSHEDGTVTVTLLKNDNKQEIMIAVKDTGIGIPKDKQDLLFEEFYQIKNDHQFTQPGSGIGLYMVKSLVNLHGGIVEVQSLPEVGSTFTITLPYKSVEEETITTEKKIITSVDEEAEITSPSIPTLLIIDDDTDTRLFLASELKIDHQIILAANGVEGLEIAKKHAIDLILCDLMMPQMDGLQFCEQLRANQVLCHIPVIMLTAKTNTESKISGLNLGVDDYITKPFEIDYLKVKIRSLLHNREMLRNVYGKNFSINTENYSESENPNNKFIAQVIDYIMKNIENTELNGEMIADSLCVSRTQLYRKLKAIANCSSNEMIKRVRLKYACSLFDAGHNNVSDVAYTAGFSSPHYFSTCFSAFYESSPKQYILKVREQKQSITQNKIE